MNIAQCTCSSLMGPCKLHAALSHHRHHYLSVSSLWKKCCITHACHTRVPKYLHCSKTCYTLLIFHETHHEIWNTHYTLFAFHANFNFVFYKCCEKINHETLWHFARMPTLAQNAAKCENQKKGWEMRKKWCVKPCIHECVSGAGLINFTRTRGKQRTPSASSSLCVRTKKWQILVRGEQYASRLRMPQRRFEVPSTHTHIWFASSSQTIRCAHVYEA